MTTEDAGDDPEQLNLGLLLFIPYRYMESAVLATLKAHGHDLPLNQARVFQRIDPRGSRLGELAQAAQLSKQTVGSIVDQLEASGYVQRVPDPSVRRARLVAITPKGHQLVQLGIPVINEIEATWEAELGPARFRQLKRTLAALRTLTDPFSS